MVSPFVDITSTFFDSSFNSFSTSTCFVLFEVTLIFKFFSLSSKSLFFTKLTVSLLLATFACANLAAKSSLVNSLNSGVAIYLLWSGILFSTAVRAIVGPKSVILGILILISFILALRAAVVAKLVILGISF